MPNIYENARMEFDDDNEYTDFTITFSTLPHGYTMERLLDLIHNQINAELREFDINDPYHLDFTCLHINQEYVFCATLDEFDSENHTVEQNTQIREACRILGIKSYDIQDDNKTIDSGTTVDTTIESQISFFQQWVHPTMCERDQNALDEEDQNQETSIQEENYSLNT